MKYHISNLGSNKIKQPNNKLDTIVLTHDCTVWVMDKLDLHSKDKDATTYRMAPLPFIP